MTDMAEVYDDGGTGPRIVLRLSRTARGERTYTVGASLPFAEPGQDAAVLARLFALDELVRRELDGAPPRAESPSVRLEGAGEPDADGWYSTPVLVERFGLPRSTIRGMLGKLVRDGKAEYRPGRGRGVPAMYRMIEPQGGAQ